MAIAKFKNPAPSSSFRFLLRLSVQSIGFRLETIHSRNIHTMPVKGDYTWTQTNSAIELFISLKGVSLKTVDIYLSDTFLKINYRPYLLEIDLRRSVNYGRSTAVCKNGNLVILLTKMHKEHWESIEFAGDDNIVMERRSDSIAKRTSNMKELHGKANEKRVEEGRMVLRRQVSMKVQLSTVCMPHFKCFCLNEATSYLIIETHF